MIAIRVFPIKIVINYCLMVKYGLWKMEQEKNCNDEEMKGNSSSSTRKARRKKKNR